jgi:hypothetical protein
LGRGEKATKSTAFSYDDKLPIHADGIGLGIIPAIGYKYHRAGTQFVLLGTSGFMITNGYYIWK